MVNHYICCLPIGDWATAIGALYLMTSLIHINYIATDMSFTLTSGKTLSEDTRQDMIVSGVRLVLELMVLITSALLIYARYKRRSGLILPWMVFTGTLDITMMFLASVRIGYYMQDKKFSGEAIMTLYSITRGVVTAYCIWILQSFRRRLHKHNVQINCSDCVQEDSTPIVAD